MMDAITTLKFSRHNCVPFPGVEFICMYKWINADAKRTRRFVIVLRLGLDQWIAPKRHEIEYHSLRSHLPVTNKGKTLSRHLPDNYMVS